ncbi:MAG: TraR/DksA C4-type zinc finger protein, partial [Patescibacteria group bacterium]
RVDVADRMDEFEYREPMVAALEGRLHQVTAASARIDAGTYGNCIVCQNQIEVERLEANPAAATCKQHLEHA